MIAEADAATISLRSSLTVILVVDAYTSPIKNCDGMIISSDGLCVRIPSMASGAERRRSQEYRLRESQPSEQEHTQDPVINRPMFSIIGGSVIGAPEIDQCQSKELCWHDGCDGYQDK